ncbi:hypothetical protein DNTS_022804 [Danionella cerebrum]|uniref:Leucine-rich repeat-containing protein 75B n=1 Tax=Danionella cerebrum TaxID=2873325 RepID=A0A553MTQ2_9TELE|nr:hypothetical protein DNTS_022804 [Danionella translucida]
MGSKLSRRTSSDSQDTFLRRTRQHHDVEKKTGGGRGELLWASLVLRTDSLSGVMKRSSPSPYERRAAWVREIQSLAREQKLEEASHVLKLLRKLLSWGQWQKSLEEDQPSLSVRCFSCKLLMQTPGPLQRQPITATVHRTHLPDLGLEGTSLKDILYRNSAFLNLVDPISHELCLNLARDLQCPKRECDAQRSSEKICRQLIYHLTPHSKWSRQNVPRRKSRAWQQELLVISFMSRISIKQDDFHSPPNEIFRCDCRICASYALRSIVLSLGLSDWIKGFSFWGSPARRWHFSLLKTTLKKKLTNNTMDLSSIPLSARDLHRVAYYLQNNGTSVTAVDISFTQLQDEGLRLLLPFLGFLPRLTTLAINGNRLTAAILKDLIELVKDSKTFPCLTWVDLGNNVDIYTVPQPLLVALRRRFGMRSSLPTIFEYSEGGGLCMEWESEETSVFEEEQQEDEDHLVLERWSIEEKNSVNVSVS